MSESYYSKQRRFRWIRAAGLAVLALVWAAPGADAELVWQEKTIEIHADVNTPVIEATFHFKNDGTTPVDIEEVQPSCGCTTAELARRHYGPGEDGQIVARYTLGDHAGLQTKTVIVTASDHSETTLSLVVHIPELLHIEPAFVAWKAGEALTAKTIQLTASPENIKLENVSVQASNSRVAAVMRPIAEGSRYEVQLTPDTTDKPAFVTLRVHCRVGAKESEFRAYATIQQPEPVRSIAPVTKPPPSPSQPRID